MPGFEKRVSRSLFGTIMQPVLGAHRVRRFRKAKPTTLLWAYSVRPYNSISVQETNPGVWEVPARRVLNSSLFDLLCQDHLIILFHSLVQALQKIRKGGDHSVPAGDKKRSMRIYQKIL